MRLLAYIVIVSMFCCVFCKNDVRALTESNGQEIIEIGPPGVRELPPELEEEPSAEKDDDDDEEQSKSSKTETATTVQVATKKEVKKPQDTRRNLSKPDEQAQEEDRRIEKELEEAYKDISNNDYKDSDGLAKDKPTNKSSLRQGSNFKFQPDLNNAKEIERFRTSMDDISCSKSVTRLDATQDLKNGAALSSSAELTLLILPIICRILQL